MTAVKICRVRDAATANALVDLGVDFLGFHVLTEGDDVLATRLSAIAADLSRSGFRGNVVLTRAVSTAWLTRLADGGFDYLQLHDRVDESYLEEASSICRARGVGLIGVAFPDPASAAYIRTTRAHCTHVLYDRYEGGTGRPIPLDLLRPMPMERAFIAGGLSPANVGEVVRSLRPFGVDVQSHVENADKTKDLGKVRALLRAVEEASC